MKTSIVVLALALIATGYAIAIDENITHIANENRRNNDKRNDPYCDACILTIGGIKSFLARNETIQQIETDEDKLCSILPQGYKNTCKHISHDYTPLVINYLENNFDTNEICDYLGLCSTHDHNDHHDFYEHHYNPHEHDEHDNYHPNEHHDEHDNDDHHPIITDHHVPAENHDDHHPIIIDHHVDHPTIHTENHDGHDI